MVVERWRPGWGLAPWRPLTELEDWERNFEDIFGRPFLPRVAWRYPTGGWIPAIDVFEKEDQFVVKAELPGMNEEDLDVSVAGDTLTIKGEKKMESEVKEKDYYRCERSYGSFMRSIPLPSSVDASKIKASYEEGVLQVTLPKAAEVKPKKVSVAARKKAAGSRKPAASK
jgi:HSP20 family protein